MSPTSNIVVATHLLLLVVLLLAVVDRNHGVRVGMMYEGWHGPSFFGRGSSGLTVGAVLASNGTLTMADIQDAGMNTSQAMNFYWHTEPQDGFYCIYRARENGITWLHARPHLTNCPSSVYRG